MKSDSAPQSSLESQISADRPIAAKSEDRLNRTGFAQAIAKVIGQWHNKPSLVIGLFGDWGSGKSSIKNLIVESLREEDKARVPVVEFSPWQVSGQDILFEVFFREIAQALGKAGGADEITTKKRVARWKLYSSALSVAATVARTWKAATSSTQPTMLGLLSEAAATTLDAGAAVVKVGADGIESEVTLQTPSLSELKGSISSDLSGLTSPILVILDDVDRLSKQEIRLVFQLVKANADFPNIVYLLLAQRETVVQALEDIAPGNGETFLEKIMQVGFDVPVLNRKQLQTFMFEGLNKLLGGETLSARFDKDHWGSLFPAIFPFFRNLRDLNRFLSSLAFHIDVFRNGESFEVNPVDLIGLEVLRVFEPGVYRRLVGEKEVLTLEPRWLRDKKREEDQRRIESIVGLASEERRDLVRKLIGVLFPPSGLSRGLVAQGDSMENRWFKELRVCSYQAFDRYFELATPYGDVSQADIDNLIAKMSDKDALGRIFGSLAERELLETMLLRLHSLSDTLPLDHASTFLSALFEIEPEEREYGFLEASPKARITGITYWYLHRLDERGRIETLKEALNRTKGIGVAVDTVGLFATNTESKGATEPFVSTLDGSEELKLACLSAIRRVTSRATSYSPNTDLGFLGYWSHWDSKSATTWLLTYLKTRENVVHFLQSFVSTSNGTDGRRRYFLMSSLEKLIPLEKLKKRIKKYVDGSLNENEAALLKLANASFKRIDDGMVEDPYQIIHGQQ